MSTGQTKPAPKVKRDSTKRTAEFEQFDILDGPFARFFHLFVKRRMMTVLDQKPYPWFIGGIHRLARMLDVADTWELCVLGLAPVIYLGLWYLQYTPLPGMITGFLMVCSGAYGGYWFVLMVFLDRRLDLFDLQRVKSVRYTRVQAREGRLLRRRFANKTMAETREKAAEARERGKTKAQQASPAPPAAPTLPDPPPTVDAAPKLDELLDLH